MSVAFRRILIANRGEIAIRVARTAADMGIATVAVYSEDDASSLHTRVADEAVSLEAVGVAAYLDADKIVATAKAAGCDAVHPGYGFLSENAAFARACAKAGIIFVGPTPETLEVCGDKAQARALAERSGAPVLPGISKAVSRDEALGFFEGLGGRRSVMLKAIAGGGGRGMRPVEKIEDLDQAFERCASEALQAFGSGDLYVEELFPRARHIEVQVAGDGTGAVVHFWDRECSLQRQRQKVVEIAPAFDLSESLRGQILKAATDIAQAVKYKGLGTMEFLVDAREGAGDRFVFIEANARLQVEHTVTEEVTGFDLVRLQLKVAGGATFAQLGLDQSKIAPPRGVARPWRPTGPRGPAAGCSRSMSRPRARASASTASATPATRPARATTRSWPS
jgi:acetyl/propionyl-CoA carboxylase alpha subunit